MKKLLRKIYDYVLYLSETKYAMAVLLFISFFGSIFFPLPTEIIMIPMILAVPKKALWISTMALIFSVLGGAAGYVVGSFLFESVGIKILELLNYVDTFHKFAGLYNEWGYWIVFAGGLTPFPYKVITIASGFVNMNFAIFIIASAMSRAVRYYFIAWLLYKYGEKAKYFIEKHLEVLTVVFFVLLFAGFYVLKFI